MSIDSSSKLKQLSNEEIREKIEKFDKYRNVFFIFLSVYSLIFLFVNWFSTTEYKLSFSMWIIKVFPCAIGSLVFGGICASITFISWNQCDNVEKELVDKLKRYWNKTAVLFVLFTLLYRFI